VASRSIGIKPCFAILPLHSIKEALLQESSEDTTQEAVKLNRSMILSSASFWLLVPLCWVPVLTADTTPGEKNLGLGVLAMVCLLVSFAVGAIALILTGLCLADYLQRRRHARASLTS
jgi:hypothetical protein